MLELPTPYDIPASSTICRWYPAITWNLYKSSPQDRLNTMQPTMTPFSPSFPQSPDRANLEQTYAAAHAIWYLTWLGTYSSKLSSWAPAAKRLWCKSTCYMGAQNVSSTGSHLETCYTLQPSRIAQWSTYGTCSYHSATKYTWLVYVTIGVCNSSNRNTYITHTCRACSFGSGKYNGCNWVLSVIMMYVWWFVVVARFRIEACCFCVGTCFPVLVGLHLWSLGIYNWIVVFGNCPRHVSSWCHVLFCLRLCLVCPIEVDVVPRATCDALFVLASTCNGTWYDMWWFDVMHHAKWYSRH